MRDLSIYLVTYSQANLEIVPSRTDFATLVKDAFENTGGHNTLVQQWCCCREEHQDGNPHYHVAIKLNMQRRWSSERKYIVEKYNIQVNFSDAPGNYYEAWKYCSKSDAEVITSANHPDFSRAPRTTAAESLLGCSRLLHPKSELLPSQNLIPHLPGKGERHLTLWIFITLS